VARGAHGATLAGAIWGLARLLVRLFYRVERTGLDVPDGPVLLVANHANGLLDPAIVVVTSRRRPRFLGKSTLFSIPVVGWFVRQVGTIPVFRRTDGADTSRNEEMFRAVQAALASGDAVCLFPEGISHSSGRLEPLKTGAARIALGAAAKGVPVRVVPIGLNFQDKEVFRSSVIVTYGAPIDCGPLAAGHAADPVEAVRALTGEIATRLRDGMIEAEPTSDADLVARVERVYSAARGLDRAPAAVVERRRLVAEGMRTLRERDPERFALLYEQLRRYERRLARFGLTEDAVNRRVPLAAAVRLAARESALAAILWPLIAAGVLAFAVPYQLVRLATVGLRASLDLQATVKIGLGLVFYPMWVCGLAWAAWRAWGGTWGLAALLALPALAVATILAQEREAAVLETVRGTLAAWRTRDETEDRLSRQRSAIAALLDETYSWLREDPTGTNPAEAGSHVRQSG
jgi:1-acyl-sn-glycerol-3-phosphate acyltransferase